MTKTLRINIVAVVVMAVSFLLYFAVVSDLANNHSGARAQQQDKPDKLAASSKATPTPETKPKTEAPSLKLSQEEINIATPLWNENMTQQREYTLAIANLRKAAKKPNDKDGHSLAVLALNAVLENAEQAQGKWNEWMTKAQATHDCKDCEINLQKWEFIKFPTEKNTAQSK